MNEVDLSSDLEAWIRLGGMDITKGSQRDDGRTVIWTGAGETRYFIHATDGWYVVTSSDRMGPESYEFAAGSMAVVEKYLYVAFGQSVRGDDLPYIRVPFQRNELRPGYGVGARDFAGRERHTLLDSNGKTVAITAIDRLVELSHYLNASVDEIKASYLAPDGKPLFTVWSDS